MILLLAAPTIVDAHRLNHALTDVVWRPDVRLLEVTHRLHLDDSARLLALVGAPNGAFTAASLAALLRYTDAHFDLWGQGGRVALAPVGAEIEGDTLYIYQEREDFPPPVSLKVSSRLLQDLWPRQVNQVNLRIGDAVWSRTQRANDPPGWLVDPSASTGGSTKVPATPPRAETAPRRPNG